jgi:hypothetical protein
MGRITKFTLFTLGLIASTGRAWDQFQPVAEADTHGVLLLEGAVDCRTFVTGPNRGDVFMINGKLFPPGTLPSGTATNDPTQPVNGVAPIGDWLVRGQNAIPFPPDVAPAYSSTPAAFATQYYILNDGRALTAEGYASASLDLVLLSVTGGIGGFKGAAGDLQGTNLGTNVTGCPNFRATFRIQPRFARAASNN